MSEPREYDLRDVEVQFISFVPRGANKKEYLAVVKEMKEDIVKTILETPDEDLAKALQEAGLEGEGAGALVGAAKVLKAYKDALPENAIAILAKCAGLALPEFEKEDVPDKAGKETKKQAEGELSKEAIAKMDPDDSGRCKAAPGGERCNQGRGQGSQADCQGAEGREDPQGVRGQGRRSASIWQLSHLSSVLC